MPKEHFEKAAKHHENASKSYKEAANHAGKGNLKDAAESAHKGLGHSVSAREEGEMGSKKHAQGNK